MGMTITVEITVNDDQAYTTREAAVIAAMQAHPSNGAAAAAAPAAAAEAQAKAPVGFTAEKPAAAKAPAKAPAKQSTRAAVLEDTPEPATAAAEPEPEEAAVDNDAEALAAMEADLAGDAPTLEDAVTQATKLVSEGKAAQVKAALLSVGAKRVSELKGDAIATFLTALAG